MNDKQHVPYLRIVLVLWLGALLNGCSLLGERPESGPGPMQPTSIKKDYLSGDGQVKYQLMLGELALMRGERQAAVQAYTEAAELSSDIRVARRATELAVSIQDAGNGIKAAERWASLAAASDEPYQILILLSARIGEMELAQQYVGRYLQSKSEPQLPVAMNSLRLLFVRDIKKSPELLGLSNYIADQYSTLADAHFLHASVLFESGQIEQSVSAAREALARKPDHVGAMVVLAQALEKQVGVDQALAYLDGQLQIHTRSVPILLGYAKLLAVANQRDKAEAVFRQVLQLDSTHPQALYSLGLLAIENRQWSKADIYLKRLVKLPGYLDLASYYLGELDHNQGNYETALKWYSQVSSGPEVVSAKIKIAIVLADMGQLPTARRYLQSMVQRNPHLATKLVLTEGELLMREKAYQDALDVYQQALSRWPEEKQILYAHSMVAERLDKIDLAESSLRKVLAMNPDDPLALNALGYTLADRTNRLEEAKMLIARALETAPDHPAFLDSMGWVYFRMGNLRKAEEYLTRAYGLFRDPEVAAHLGELLWVTGRREEAHQVWADGLAIDADNDVLLATMARLTAE